MTLGQIGTFFTGLGNAYFSDNLGGFRRGSSSDNYYSAGQNFGDRFALAQGAIEASGAISAGIVSDIGGLILALPSGGLSLGGAVAVNGITAAGAVHGISTAGTASYYLSKSKGNGAKYTERAFFVTSLFVPGEAGEKAVSKAAQIGEEVTQYGLQWSKGRFGSSVENLGFHFLNHEQELKALGIDSAQKMYDKAMELARSVDNKNTFDFMSPFVQGGLDVYNKTSNLIVGLNKDLEISTLHSVTKTGKLEAISKQVQSITNSLKNLGN